MLNLCWLELKFQSKHWSFLLVLLLALLFGLFLVNRQTPDIDLQIAGSYFITHCFIINMLMLPIVVVLFINRAFVRDFEHQTLELLYSRCANKSALLFSRLLILVVICFTIYLAFAIGIYLGLLNHTWLSSSMSNFTFSSSLIIATLAWVLTVLILPNLLVTAAVFMLAALYFKRSLPLYLLAIVFYLSYQLFLLQTGSPMMANSVVSASSLHSLFSMIDPFGITAYFEQVALWSPEQKNSVIASCQGPLLFNRLAVLIVTVIIVYVAWLQFNLKLPKLKNAHATLPTKNSAIAARKNTTKVSEISTALIQLSHGKLAKLRCIIAVEYQLTIRNKLFVTVCLILIFAMASEIISGYHHLENMGVSAIASMSITINRYFFDLLPRFGSLFILLIAVEIYWRDHSVNIKQLIDSSPVSNLTLFIGRFLALVLVPVSFISLAIVVSMLLQLSYGGTIDLLVYLSFYWLAGLPMLCVAAMCSLVHALCRNRFLALAISFLVFISTSSSMLPNIGLEHGLWRFASTPLAQFSDVTGFSGNIDGFWGYMLVWLSMSVLMLMLGFGLFQRGTALSLRYRLQQLNTLWGNSGKILAGFSLLVLTFAIANVLEKTFGDGHYQSSTKQLAWKLAYEQRYADTQTLPTLTIEKVTTEVDLLPAKRSFSMQGNYRLKNRNQTEISTVFITIPKQLNYQNITLNGATLVQQDQALGVFEFAFSPALAPNQQTSLTFNASYQQNGYQPLPTDNKLHEDIQFFRSIRYMPWLGYQRHYQIANETLRAQYGLPPLANISLEQDIEQHQGDFSDHYDWAEIETTISTSADHVAIAPGRLVKRWQANGRNLFHYQTNGKIRHVNYFLSTNMALAQDRVDGIQLQVFHQAATQEYAQRHLAAMKDALRYGNQHFGQYKADDLRLVQMPSLDLGTGYAMPQTILIAEAVGFNVDLADPEAFDHLYRRTVHETAHQWWGHELNGADTEGVGVLVETLAKYTELMLLEHKYGVDYVKRLVDFEQQRYFRGRAQASKVEVPLYRADASYLIYSKGAAAMYAIRHSLGEQKMNSALATLVENFAYPKPPATSLDLIALLQRQANDEQKNIIKQWFYEITTNDWQVEQAVTSQRANGMYNADVCLTNRYPSVSNPNIKIYSKNNVLLLDTPLWQLASINTDQSHCFQLELITKPERVMIDAELMLLDSDRANNEQPFTTLAPVTDFVSTAKKARL